MTHKPDLNDLAQRYPVAVLVGGDFNSGPTPGDAPSLWAVTNDRLRGRWRLTFIIGAILSAILACAGYLSTGPKYVSTAAIRVAPRLRVTLTPIQETGRLDHFSAFVATQEQLIRSRRVLETAVKDEQFKHTAWGKGPDALLELDRHLEVDSDRHSELIYVRVEADSPQLAQSAVNAVVKSYYDIYGKVGGDEINQTLQELDDYQAKLRRDLRANLAEKQRVLSRYETSNLRELQSLKLHKITDVQEQVSQAQVTLAQLQLHESSGETNTPAALGATLRLLQSFDPKLAQLRARRDEAETEFRFISQRFQPTSYAYRRSEQDLQAAQHVFQQRYTETLRRWQEQGGAGSDGGPVAALTPKGLGAQIESLKQRAAVLREESRQISHDLQALDELGLQEERLQNDLDRALGRIQQLELEESSVRSGRINVAQWGYLPQAPQRDARTKRALFGAVAGLLLSFGFFFVLGTLDRRTFDTSQLDEIAKDFSAPCLGVLPDLTRTFAEAESRDVAAHCVHQIRNQIEIARPPRDGYVLVVTSPFQGDGKTSIVMALGWSYAASGHRTLIVDCDLVGRSLTRQLGMVGQDGLREALSSHHIHGMIVALAAPGLSALPVGCDPHFRSETLRRADLQLLFDSIRDAFDIIIVDTGPMLGSLESTPVTASADGVVLSVRRGRSRDRLDECLQRLKAVGTPCLGVILNCAVRSQCDRYVSEASLAAADHERRDAPAGAPDPVSIIRTGEDETSALMRAMESASPLHRRRDQTHDAA